MKRLQVVGFLRRSVREAKGGLMAAIFCLAPICASAQEAQPAAEASGQASVQDQAKAESEVRSEVVDKTVVPLLDEGKALSGDGKYAEAKACYMKAMAALDSLGSGSYVVSKRELAKSLLLKNGIKWGNSEMARARAKYVEGLASSDLKLAEAKYSEALAIAQGIERINPAMKESADAFISDCKKMGDANNFKQATSLENIDPQNASRKDEINVLLKQSEILYANKQYSKVRDNMEKILIKDPYNEQAIFMLDKVYKKLYKVAEARRENEVIERMAEIEWKWNQAVLPTENVLPKDQGPKEKKNSKSGLYDKLQKLIFDDIEFEEATISSVISYLSARSKQVDSEGLGINLVLQMTPDEAAKVPKVNMSFERIPMSEAIRYLCQSSGLKYRVEDKAILIGTKSIDDMDIRFFQVRAALVSTISNGTSDTEEAPAAAEGSDLVKKAFGDGGSENTFKAGGEAGKAATKMMNSATSEALTKFFNDRGVPFEEGSAIAYDKRAGKLIVKNTPENLRKLESLLRDLDIQTPLVLIESKIMEISQNDLEELGFDWVLSQNSMNKSYYVPPTDQILRNYASNSNKNASGVGGSHSDNYAMINNLKILPNTINGFDVNLTIDAIQQTDRSEVLSSPKVIATSGTTAIIRMVTEMYFPQSWTDPDVSIGNNTFQYTPSYPEFGDPTDVGIRFEVTPTVSPNNYTISLHLNPQIVSLSGWTQYPYRIVVRSTAAARNMSASLNVKMPELSRRDLNTNIKVYDGETVVLGGMLKDSSYQRDDKWPGLGEVPLVGRLFASQMSQAQKRNLLIFVTSRLMSCDGVPVRTNSANGMFEFNR